MLKVAVTGGIGSGKTTVTNMFHSLFSVPVIDADIIARKLLSGRRTDSESLLHLVYMEIGEKCFKTDGSLDRSCLAETVFSNTILKEKLEAILHPAVYAQIEHDLMQLDSPYCLVSVPLLVETRQSSRFDRVLVIDAGKNNQISRAAERDPRTIEQIKQIIASQASEEERLAAADDVIDNSGDISLLRPQVEKLHSLYLKLAQQHSPDTRDSL